jgi:hypothetical protein
MCVDEQCKVLTALKDMLGLLYAIFETHDKWYSLKAFSRGPHLLLARHTKHSLQFLL